VGVSRDWPIFGYPQVSQEWVKLAYELQICPEHSQGPSEQKPIKNFGKKEAWAYPDTAQVLWVAPIILGTGKATNFKFCMYIHRNDGDESPLSRKVAVGVLRNSRGTQM